MRKQGFLLCYIISGGKTEYIVTIACVIGKSRMKGARVVTNLLPYGAEKPRQVFYQFSNFSPDRP